MSAHDAYHAGEIAVQERAGERAIAQRRATMIADRLGEGAQAFLNRQGTVAVAAAAPDGALWASLWCGVPGFLRADEQGTHVELISAVESTAAIDPVRTIISDGAPLAMLVIDFATRQRLRINGTVDRVEPTGLGLSVREAFGNCIKYIQRRHRIDDLVGEAVAHVENGRALDDERRRFIEQTDTAFVASIHPERGVDVSHRGGHPGFMQLVGESTLRIPDYPGNSMYQTLGNFDVDTRAGLALVDFERRRVLSLTGHALLTFGAEDPRYPTGGTNRYWSFAVERWIEYGLPSAMTWKLVERSPFNPPVFLRER